MYPFLAFAFSRHVFSQYYSVNCLFFFLRIGRDRFNQPQPGKLVTNSINYYMYFLFMEHFRCVAYRYVCTSVYLVFIFIKKNTLDKYFFSSSQNNISSTIILRSYDSLYVSLDKSPEIDSLVISLGFENQKRNVNNTICATLKVFDIQCIKIWYKITRLKSSRFSNFSLFKVITLNPS